MSSDIHADFDAILHDTTSGSSDIAQRVCQVLKKVPLHDLAKNVEKILEAHASMAAVINAVNRTCLNLERDPVPTPRDHGDRVIEDFWRENKDRKHWITLSNSHGVRRCLAAAPHKLEIKVGISHPDTEGVLTAGHLGKRHRVTIYEDTKLVGEVQSADAILIGTDLITDDHIVNKIGSLALALGANFFDRPFYVMSSGEKFLTPDLSIFFKVKIDRSGNRLIHYFEPVPRQLVRHIYLTSPPADHPISATMRELGEARIAGEENGPENI